MTHPVNAGVTTNIAEYLKTPNVGCVGGSWLTPANAVERSDWADEEEAVHPPAKRARAAGSRRKAR